MEKPNRSNRLAENHGGQQYPQLNIDTLSMGMSADLELAIAEGSTLVRIGTDIFGPRHEHSQD